MGKFVIPTSHMNFIQHVADGKTFKEAYKLSIRDKGLSEKTAEVNGSKLGKKYQYEINLERTRQNKILEDTKTSEVVKDSLKNILSQSEVDAKLCEIITNAFTLVRDGTSGKVVKVENTTGDRLKAIDIYYKRFGHYVIKMDMSVKKYNLSLNINHGE